jgi:hypothetical protein
MMQFPEHETGAKSTDPKIQKIDKLARLMNVLIHVDGVPYGKLSDEKQKDTTISHEALFTEMKSAARGEKVAKEVEVTDTVEVEVTDSVDITETSVAITDTDENTETKSKKSTKKVVDKTKSTD